MCQHSNQMNDLAHEKGKTPAIKMLFLTYVEFIFSDSAKGEVS